MLVNKPFKIVSKHTPAGDQKQAIDQMVRNIQSNEIKRQVLLGATGTGKTFSVANVIAQTQMKTLVLAHNKTLAAQLYTELKELFPENKVEYFISYFDYYQPEAYKPNTDTYIEKDAITNQEIERMRLSTINSLATANDVIVVASVACIYASVSTAEFIKHQIFLKQHSTLDFSNFKKQLILLGYERVTNDLLPGTFKIKGGVVEIMFGYADDYKIEIVLDFDEIATISKKELLTNKLIENYSEISIYAATEYIFNEEKLDIAIQNIRDELKSRVAFFNKENKLIESQRIEQRTNQDIEAILEFGYCSGVENYYRHLEHREPEQTPWTIFDFFSIKQEPWLMIIDESHNTLPQVKGMHNTDRSRKQTLVDYGFRLPSALDNRPLNYDEFNQTLDNVIYVSATPNDEEIALSNGVIVSQIVRPTGLLDPVIEIRPTEFQIDDLIRELNILHDKNERAFINVMTIKMAEELSSYLNNTSIKSAYLHNELKTLERTYIINRMRAGVFDCIVGINLLREGIDAPEVSTVFIFDADKPGFFRSDKSLIQIIGRAARNANGKVIMYADIITPAMQTAIDETNRRRQIQMKYNEINNIVPKTIVKPIPMDLNEPKNYKKYERMIGVKDPKAFNDQIRELKKLMQDAAFNQEYEQAAYYRDLIFELQANKKIKDGDK
ncbi:excinuclease ABC subunit UvrB [Ureaplasma zalophigenitalium]|uniref:UvrABC system protein B n=1 Tax=Ureaplasma zalophigenitalium TaxID=907723 RepID=A0ABT3BNI1_9BACT|nr:excinuclease ABC subunit UvrB [Ureaplasma zalophigenitalium]MCV3753818.1 excinuclease ABC subunit UvrB [Ureaplasma zalophigenitalium]